MALRRTRRQFQPFVKRFTETQKWDDPWFQELSFDAKMVWLYVLDRCDNAGVWDPNRRLANFATGRDPDWPAIEAHFVSTGRIQVLENGKWWVRKFVEFQCGELSPKSVPHNRVVQLLVKHGLPLPVGYPTDTLPIAYVKGRLTRYPSGTLPIPKAKGSDTLKEEEEEEEEDKEQDKTLLQLRVEGWFHRRRTTPWDKNELKAWHANRLVIEATPEEDLALLDWWFGLPNGSTCRRHGIEALLNHWNTEITRAQAHKNGDSPHGTDPNASRNSRSFSQRNDYSGVKNI